ncbi:MAG: FecR domain-containing protein [Deltaproteobacteria bacterium]|nr:FecR domain-containing protein [Deltaproteobacteria bacterium]
MSKKILRLPLLFLFAAFLLMPSTALASAGALDTLSGAVFFMAKGKADWGSAVKGAEVNVGDRIKTGADGRALIIFGDGTKIMLGNDSELEISEYMASAKKRSAVYTLATGKVRAIVTKFAGKSDIKVKTRTAVAGVRGTDFIVMNQGNANVMFGNEGRVAASATDGKDSVQLKAGQMTENTSGVVPIKPIVVEPGTPLAEARAALVAVTDPGAPIEWEAAGKLPAILARWNVNYGHYLADSKRFKDALNIFQIAIDLTEISSIRAEAHLERGTVLSRNLGDPKSALAEYTAVMERYPVSEFVDNAVYSAGVIYMDMGDKENARRMFTRYLSDYPKGARRGTVEILLKSLGE